MCPAAFGLLGTSTKGPCEVRMNARNWIVAGLAFGLLATAHAESSGRVSVSHVEPLQKLSVSNADGVGPAAMKFDALGNSFDLKLEPNLGFLSPKARDALPEGIAVYRGALAGNPNSWARITFYNGQPSGMFWDGNEMFVIPNPLEIEELESLLLEFGVLEGVAA